VEEIKDELADVLFSVVNVSRHLKLDPESLLRQGNAKFERRYRSMEQLAMEKGQILRDLDIMEQEKLWQESKKLES
jgi:ATP diphosphatase